MEYMRLDTLMGEAGAAAAAAMAWDGPISKTAEDDEVVVALDVPPP